MDSTALPRLAALEGKVIEIDCRQPALQVFILPDEEGLMLAAHWEGEVDCTLRAPAGSLAQLALSQDKTAVLHSPQVELHGDSAVLLDLFGVLQDLELDWEYELQRWLGPVATPCWPATCACAHAGPAKAWHASARTSPNTWPKSPAPWSASAKPKPPSANSMP
jgi:ubiquinone biosynthesis protein UbiJ